MSKKEIFKKEKEAKLNAWYPRKSAKALRYIDEEEVQRARRFVRGSVHLCELGENIGSEQGEERPVIIVSNDRINSTSGNVMVIPLTKNLKKKTIITRKKEEKEVPRVRSHYFLTMEKYPFLTYNSAAMAECVTTVSKIRIGKHLGEITDGDLNAIMSRLKWVFNFD